MALHDYVCDNCGHMEENQLSVPAECPCGDPKFQWSCLNWKGANIVDRREAKSDNDLVDDRGYRRRFTALEDPTVQIELGLADGKGIGTFTQEQRQDFGNKIARDGDTPAMRREILRQRTKNLREQGLDAPDCM